MLNLICFWHQPVYPVYACKDKGELSQILQELSLDSGKEIYLHSPLRGNIRRSYIPLARNKQNFIVRLFHQLIWKDYRRDFKQTALFIREFIRVNEHLLHQQSESESRVLRDLYGYFHDVPETRNYLDRVIKRLDQENNESWAKAKEALNNKKATHAVDLAAQKKKQESDLLEMQQNYEIALANAAEVGQRHIEELNLRQKEIENETKEVSCSISNYIHRKMEIVAEGIQDAKQVTEKPLKKEKEMLQECEVLLKQCDQQMADYTTKHKMTIMGPNQLRTNFRHLLEDPKKQNLCFVAKGGQKLLANSAMFDHVHYITNAFREGNQAVVKVNRDDEKPIKTVKENQEGVERVLIDLGDFSPEAVETMIHYYYGVPISPHTPLLGEIHALANLLGETAPSTVKANQTWQTLQSWCEEQILPQINDTKTALEFLDALDTSLNIKIQLAKRVSRDIVANQFSKEFRSLSSHSKSLICEQENVLLEDFEVAGEVINQLSYKNKLKAAIVLARSIEIFIESEEFKKLSPESLFLILDAKSINVQSEHQVFKALKTWALAQTKQNALKAAEMINRPVSAKNPEALIDVVQFHLLSKQDLGRLLKMDGNWFSPTKLNGWQAYVPEPKDNPKEIAHVLRKERSYGIHTSLEILANGKAKFEFNIAWNLVCDEKRRLKNLTSIKSPKLEVGSALINFSFCISAVGKVSLHTTDNCKIKDFSYIIAPGDNRTNYETKGNLNSFKHQLNQLKSIEGLNLFTMDSSCINSFAFTTQDRHIPLTIILENFVIDGNSL